MKHLIKACRICPIFCLLAVFLAGCSSEPVKPAGFAKNPELMKKYDLVPLDKVWKDPAFDSRAYNSIMIVPVFTRAQLDKSWMEEANVRTWMDEESQDVKDFAKYTENAFRKAVQKSRNYKLVDKPGPRTLIFELALVKIVPEKPILGVAKTAATPVIGAFRAMAFVMAPVKTAVSANTDSPLQASVAIEGNIRDSMTKKVVASFADREKQTSAIINFQDFSAYGNLEQIVDEWAREFLEIMDKRPLQTGVKVEDERPAMKLINP
ncbi:MAG TPA: hypothetical protein DET40_13535 [Lentisphaeria bacterium]|nr:MAG: hypothetical protein A2X45_01660 [Lentisphaerae bacterium GWF2_50_93]HCE44563.1 hypothetical protein [Lentisphaeria bacterium]